MTASSASDPGRLAALTLGLRIRLDTAVEAGETDRAEELRGELALLEDLAVPEAVSELRMQRLSYAAAEHAMARPLPPALVDFLA